MAELRRDIWPSHVFVTEDAREDRIAQRVLSRLEVADPIPLPTAGDPLTQLQAYWPQPLPADETSAERFSRGKRALVLTRYKGEWLKSCPGTSGHVCCNLLIVNPGEGCPFDCTYCYLQTYLVRNPTLKLYTNIDSMIEALEARVKPHPGRLFRIGTGEVIDSLVWDELSDFTCEIVPRVAQWSNAILELKTKDSYVDNLVQMRSEHADKTVVSWSVNARTITENDEAATASLDARIEAAAHCVDAGYRVGFHFDPMIHFPGWEDEYLDAIKSIFNRIPPSRVAWVSVSTLRCKPELHEMMLARFPQSAIPFGEQILGKDGKRRYMQPLRLKMLNLMWRELKAVDAALPIYMCMESTAAWRTVAGGLPHEGQELVEIFSKRGRLAVVNA